MSRSLPESASLRARRWDVLVLGGALPGLAAAVRLAMGGLRVLIAEEEEAARTPALLREPFFLPAPGDPVLEALLRALGVPLIERHAIATDEVAFQVLQGGARLEIGTAGLTAEELVAWGLAKPDDARALVEGLASAARAEAEALLEADFVKAGGALRGIARGVRPSANGSRGLPAAVGAADGEVRSLLELIENALTRGAPGRVSPEARARLLGSPLGGAARFERPDQGLRELLRRRLEALHVEFRTLGCPFRMVELGDQPGIARIGPDDVWCGRGLVLNAPLQALASALQHWDVDVPRMLRAEGRPSHRQMVHARILREALPEPLARCAIIAARDGGPPLRLIVHPSPRGSRFAELVVESAMPASAGGGPWPDKAEREATAERIVRELQHWLPFSEGRMKVAPLPPSPLWDDERVAIESDGADATGWPAPLELRAAGRRPVYQLPRDGAACLGTEGELLLGWRAGDAIREELA
jgi:hypothetical protein